MKREELSEKPPLTAKQQEVLDALLGVVDEFEAAAQENFPGRKFCIQRMGAGDRLGLVKLLLESTVQLLDGQVPAMMMILLVGDARNNACVVGRYGSVAKKSRHTFVEHLAGTTVELMQLYGFEPEPVQPDGTEVRIIKPYDFHEKPGNS